MFACVRARARARVYGRVGGCDKCHHLFNFKYSLNSLNSELRKMDVPVFIISRKINLTSMWITITR